MDANPSSVTTMLAEPSTVVAALADVVYAKTAQGRLEVARRSAGLGARQRSVLIMLDGHKTAGALATLMPAAQLTRILVELVELGLIAPVTASGTAPANDDARLAPVKAMMIRTAETCLGLIAADLVRQIGAAGDEHQLQRAIGHWHMAMQDSKYGREVVATHLELIKAALQSPASVPA
ncbi:hypothetical protein [Massilia sp. HP4]|uniref:hypothetical protein n=1 Tax=Massilia sp. HP4 TaxID=2562316 RepID=UPI0010C07DCD|nr:hypothetical protein [Massilia sp. HP4]